MAPPRPGVLKALAGDEDRLECVGDAGELEGRVGGGVAAPTGGGGGGVATEVVDVLGGGGGLRVGVEGWGGVGEREWKEWEIRG